MKKTTLKTKLVLDRQMIRALVTRELTQASAGQDGGADGETKGPGTCPVVRFNKL